jgi:hypothetical protein
LIPTADDAGNSSTLGNEQNVFNDAETGLPKNNDPLPHICSDCSPELRYVGMSEPDHRFYSAKGDVLMKRIYEGIAGTRRRFLSMAAFGLAAAKLGLVRSASAQSNAPGLPAVRPEAFFPGFSAEMVRTAGTTIHVLRKGVGRPLLLLHGYPETHVTWHKVAPKLAEQYSVVAPDLRGYGDSGKPQDGERHENYSFRAMAQDQVDVMQHYGHERFLVAAHDRGARVAHRLCPITPRGSRKFALWTLRPPSQCIGEQIRSLPQNTCGGSF